MAFDETLAERIRQNLAVRKGVEQKKKGARTTSS
jgi:hypothetical protein